MTTITTIKDLETYATERYDLSTEKARERARELARRGQDAGLRYGQDWSQWLERCDEADSAIQAELARLEWLCIDSNPTAFAVYLDVDLPKGWVRLADDEVQLFGSAADVLTALKAIPVGADYGSGLDAFVSEITEDNWPSELLQVEQLEEGAPNDNPNTLLVLQTNGGARYVAGPHGVDFTAFQMPFCMTREEAISAGCEN